MIPHPTPHSCPPIWFVVLNLRMGGQASGLNALQSLLTEEGVNCHFLLPDGAVSMDKTHLQTYMALPFVTRLKQVWRMLREARQRINNDDALLHILLPSPAFSWLTFCINFPKNRILIQYEGLTTRLDSEHIQAFWEDPWMMLPRMVLNNRIWSRLGRSMPTSHLGVGMASVNHLKSLGYQRVFEGSNVSHFTQEDQQESLNLPKDFNHPKQILLAYVGHTFPVKGVDDLLKAFSLAIQRQPHLRLIVALSADGNQKQVCHRLKQLNLAPHQVYVTGLVPVGTLLKRIDGLVLPYRSSLTTTLYPSLILEAHAAQCPLITTTIAAWRTIFDPNSSSLSLTPPRNTKQLAKVLTQWPSRHNREWHPILRLAPNHQRCHQIIETYKKMSLHL